MRKRFVVVSLFILLTALPFAGKKKSADPIMPDVTARGLALYEYDQAAWHASDALQAMHPPTQYLGRYIAHKSGAAWEVVFGRLNDTRDKFLVAYKATQGAIFQQFTVAKLDPPQEDTSFYVVAARAIDTALHDFHGQKRPYNAAVLPASGDQLYVYVVPAQTENGVYPLGGDVRYLVSPDGNTIVEKRQLHMSIIESRGNVPKRTTIAAGMHTHVLSDVPEDTDVFYVLTRKPPIPELIGTRNRKLYEISLDGTIREERM
jgi:hypothetical protein